MDKINIYCSHFSGNQEAENSYDVLACRKSLLSEGLLRLVIIIFTLVFWTVKLCILGSAS